MSEVPEWVNEPEDCPEDGCDGKVWYVMEGDWYNPVAKYQSTCGHVSKRVGTERSRGGRP